jgi:hypothetical protein
MPPKGTGGVEMKTMLTAILLASMALTIRAQNLPKLEFGKAGCSGYQTLQAGGNQDYFNGAFGIYIGKPLTDLKTIKGKVTSNSNGVIEFIPDDFRPGIGVKFFNMSMGTLPGGKITFPAKGTNDSAYFPAIVQGKSFDVTDWVKPASDPTFYAKLDSMNVVYEIGVKLSYKKPEDAAKEASFYEKYFDMFGTRDVKGDFGVAVKERTTSGKAAVGLEKDNDEFSAHKAFCLSLSKDSVLTIALVIPQTKNEAEKQP